MSKTVLTRENWIVRGRTGVSSKVIWAHFMLDCEPRYSSPPCDPSDFLRCYWLLKIAPAWRARIFELGQRYSSWITLTEHWAELEEMLLKAWPRSCQNGDYEDEPPAREMYARMKELGL